MVPRRFCLPFHRMVVALAAFGAVFPWVVSAVEFEIHVLPNLNVGLPAMFFGKG